MANDASQQPKLTPAQEEQLRKVYQDLSSRMRGLDLAQLMPETRGFTSSTVPNLTAIARAVAPTQNFALDLAKSLQDNLPKFNIQLPPLNLNYSRLFGPALNLESLGLHKLIDTSSLTVFNEIYSAQRAQFEGIFENITRMFDEMLPPNWRGLRTLDQIETILLDEGLALAWVPPTDILNALLKAASKQERRRILGRRWKQVVAACRACIESASVDDFAEYRRFALDIVSMLDEGHPAGAQALAANLLDTMLRETLDGPSRQKVTSQRTRLSIDDLPMRAAMVFGGIWGSHTEFWQSRGDRIPREFTRHGSAHAVSRLQYSRINAVIALMHVTAYIMLLDSGDLS